MYSRDFPYNDFPYNDYPYQDFPYELDKGARPASRTKEPSFHGSWHLRPMVFSVLFFLRSAPIWTLAYLTTSLVKHIPKSGLASIGFFILMIGLSWFLYQRLKSSCTQLKGAGSKYWIPLYICLIFWACILPAITWFTTLEGMLHSFSNATLYSFLFFLLQAALTFHSFHHHSNQVSSR